MNVKTILLILFSIFTALIEAPSAHDYEQTPTAVSFENFNLKVNQLSSTTSSPIEHCNIRVHCCHMKESSLLDYNKLLSLPLDQLSFNNFNINKLELNSVVTNLDRPPANS